MNEANRQGNSSTTQNQDSNATDGPFSQDRNTNQSDQNNMDQQQQGSDADYAQSVPGTQNTATRNQNMDNSEQQSGENPSYNSNSENQEGRQQESSLDRDERSGGSAL